MLSSRRRDALHRLGPRAGSGPAALLSTRASSICRQSRPAGSAPMTPVSARNIEFVGHSDQNGRCDGVQVMVHKGHAFVGHMFADGYTITYVLDPRTPRTVKFVEAPPNSRAFHLLTHARLVLRVNSPHSWV